MVLKKADKTGQKLAHLIMRITLDQCDEKVESDL